MTCLHTCMTSVTLGWDSLHPRQVGWDVLHTVQVGTVEELRHRQVSCPESHKETPTQVVSWISNKYSEQERPYRTGLMVLYSLDSVRVPEQLWEMLQLLAGEGIYRSAAFSKGDGIQQPLSLPQHPGPSV